MTHCRSVIHHLILTRCLITELQQSRPSRPWPLPFYTLNIYSQCSLWWRGQCCDATSLYAHCGADELPVKPQPAKSLLLSTQVLWFLSSGYSVSEIDVSWSDSTTAEHCCVPLCHACSKYNKALRFHFPLMWKPGENGLTLSGGRTLKLVPIAEFVAGVLT